MTNTVLAGKIEELRALAATSDHDSRTLFDQLQDVFDQLRAAGQAIPADLRQMSAELEGEIVDEFFDNLPV
ncbi:MAG: hypothetical protein OIF40_14065 [Mangrovicoccus sp.]|nr:hypothetical protein [Mangrovicoccus sp.]